MPIRVGLAAAILALAALLPAQAQAPKSGGTKPAAAPASRFSISGAVNKPGIYELKSGSRLSDALNSAAGPTERADLGIIMLSHAGKSGGTATMVWVNFNDFVLHGKMSGNPLIQVGYGICVLVKRKKYREVPEFPQPRLVY